MNDFKKARTINGAYEEIVSMDPNTAITKNAIRQAVVNNEIPSRKVGRTYLVTLEDVYFYFTAREGSNGND